MIPDPAGPTANPNPTERAEAQPVDRDKIRDIAETYLYDGDHDQALPGYHELLDAVGGYDDEPAAAPAAQPDSRVAELRSTVPASDETPTAEDVARAFHETYERLAPDFGYKTREASAKPWADVPEQNKTLMRAVAERIRRRWIAGALHAGDAVTVHEGRRRIDGTVKYLGNFAPPLMVEIAAQPDDEAALTGAELIAAERQRQIEAEGYDATHDAGHLPVAFVEAAISYEGMPLRCLRGPGGDRVRTEGRLGRETEAGRLHRLADEAVGSAQGGGRRGCLASRCREDAGERSWGGWPVTTDETRDAIVLALQECPSEFTTIDPVNDTLDIDYAEIARIVDEAVVSPLLAERDREQEAQRIKLATVLLAGHDKTMDELIEWVAELRSEWDALLIDSAEDRRELDELLAERDEAREHTEEYNDYCVKLTSDLAAARARVDALEAEVDDTANLASTYHDGVLTVLDALEGLAPDNSTYEEWADAIRTWRGVATQPAEPPSPDFAMRAFGPCTEQGSHHIYGELFDGRCDVPGHWPAPATQPAEPPRALPSVLRSWEHLTQDVHAEAEREDPEIIPWCTRHDADARSCDCPEGRYENVHVECPTVGGVCIGYHMPIPSHKIAPAAENASPLQHAPAPAAQPEPQEQPYALLRAANGGWCERCRTVTTGSHWHCGRCGKPSGQMGHAACFGRVSDSNAAYPASSSGTGTEAHDPKEPTDG
ncbi:MAG TPA: hypothetical protein VHX38_02000 [Pseudonocardiaceae bacterium]|jgi:hypothetical protein|nr:hypothetical protein [Pseudonocardiaceae bacterium]